MYVLLLRIDQGLRHRILSPGTITGSFLELGFFTVTSREETMEGSDGAGSWSNFYLRAPTSNVIVRILFQEPTKALLCYVSM